MIALEVQLGDRFTLRKPLKSEILQNNKRNDNIASQKLRVVINNCKEVEQQVLRTQKTFTRAEILYSCVKKIGFFCQSFAGCQNMSIFEDQILLFPVSKYFELHMVIFEVRHV